MDEKPVRPPQVAKFILRMILLEEELYEKLGDFEEGFHHELQEKGARKARSWYRLQAFRLVPNFIRNFIYWRVSMFRNYLKIAFRNIQRHKVYSFINITGLALGMACCILILLWVKDELATDTFHGKLDSLYQLRHIQHHGSEVYRGSGSVPALGPALKAEYPEVINAARHENGQGEHLLEYGDKQFKEYLQLADPEIFELFTFPFTLGNPRDTFGEPYVMVLAESVAGRIFGSENPIGKTITLNKKEEFRVVGVMKDIPHNSTIRFNVWAPLELANKWYRPNFTSTWYNLAFRTYVEMVDNVNVEAFNKKIFNRIRQSQPNTNTEPFIYPFSKVYREVWGRMENIRTFSIIAFVILIIACINFMNLATARSAHRAREVGMRKVIGAHRQQVMRQFFGESILFTFISLVVASGLVLLFLSPFRNITRKPLHLGDFIDPIIIFGVLGVTVITGLMSGSYPALFLSAFRPAAVLKGSHSSHRGAGLFRKILVVLQFALSIILIIGTIVIYNQVHFMKNKSLGFDREHLLYVRLEGQLFDKIEAFKHELLQNPGIQSASATSHSPTGVYNNGQDWEWEGRDPNVNPLVTYFGVDPDFVKTFKMEIVQGENFRPAKSHAFTSVIINECFAKIMGMPDVIGQRLSQDDTHLQIIGVVRDFHFRPVNREIGPAIVYFDPNYRILQRYRYMFIRLNPGDLSTTIAHVEKIVKEFNPGFPFEYRFLDEDYDRLYRSVEREMTLVRTFSFLAILISCLGLFGLAAFTAEQRTKEIGVRKVLGASAAGVVVLLSKQYAKWVLAANVIAWPVGYWLMKNWLQDFDYRTSLGVSIFLLAAALSVLIAQLTVSFQALKAARSNPVESLRYE